MGLAYLSHIAYTLFFPPIVLLLLLLLLPPFFLFKLIHSFLPFTGENIAGKVVLITGASSGIGEQLAYRYAKFGALLVLVARREHELSRVAEKCRSLGSPNVLVAPADVTKSEECKKFVDKAIGHFGQLNHLVVNAGVASSCLFEEVTDILKFKEVMDVNFWGSIYPTHYAIPHLRNSKGNIIVTASVAGRVPISRLSFYNASKAATLRFYETLRAELSSDIKVTIATPGFVESELTRGKLMLKEGQIRVDQEVRDVTIGLLPVASSEKCAEAIVDSARKGERYMTWPSWYRATYLVMFLAPEFIEWFSRLYYVTKPGSPQTNALSKRTLDLIGARKLYPQSIRPPDRSSNPVA